MQMEAQGQPSVSDSELQQKWEETDKAKQDAEIRVDKAESTNKSELEKGWKLWLAQVAELQLLRADRDNRKVHGP